MELLSDCPALKEQFSILGDTITNFVRDTSSNSVFFYVQTVARIILGGLDGKNTQTAILANYIQATFTDEFQLIRKYSDYGQK